MESRVFRVSFVLSVIVAALAALASGVGLFADVYRNNALTTLAFRGNDMVTLIVGVPILVVAIIAARRGSVRGLLVWMGMLVYMVYNYVFYLYAAAFSALFLPYVALVALSMYALIFALPRIDAQAVSETFRERTPARLIAGYMAFFGALLGFLWIMKSAEFIVTGVVPEDITKTGHVTGVVYATDLVLLVPALIVGALLLWSRKPWGFLAATTMMIKACSYAVVLLVMSAITFVNTGAGDPYTPLWIVLAVGCLVSLVLLLGNMGDDGKTVRTDVARAQAG
jgi:hypothetical protein